MGTVWGVMISVIFVVCYMGQSISSGMQGKHAQILQWGCWALAIGSMFICYFFTQIPAG
jgi:hypothetical protein